MWTVSSDAKAAYFARLAVPIRLRARIGKTELIATTGTRGELALAKAVPAAILAN